MKPKLSSTVSVVKISKEILEFFKTNTRQQVRIKADDDTIMNIVSNLDGEKDIEDISKEFNVDRESLIELFEYLRNKGILDNTEPKVDFYSYEAYRRVIHFLNDFADSHSKLCEYWNKINNANVLIIGLGAVGSWVACNLVQSGIGNITLMDNDVVDISNLHRQFGYDEMQVGEYKVDALEKRLKQYNSEVKISKIKAFLDDSNLSELINEKIDLIINCADKPNVDTTSLWVGEYAMKNNIPHIVGGGYNLHLSLIGQTIMPGQSACVKCFQKTLEEENKIDPTKVKKLMIKNRKVGSFGPMCSMIASFVGMEAIKVITECVKPANLNRRGEFDIYTMDIKYKDFEKRKDCEWCGENGIYFN